MTVKFVLKKPEAPFMADMAMYFASILSAEYADKMMAAKTPDVIDREPIGTGPFQFVSYQKDAVIRYKAFDQHWGGRPKIDNLVYAITTDASVRYAKLKTGECHVMAFPKPADVALMKNDPAINLVSQQGLNVGYIAFNVEKKPFDSKLVRQALNMAVNKKAILDNVFQGAGQVAKNPIPPTLWSYNDKVTDYAYDPAKAKDLLAKAGFPNGTEVELWYLPVTRPYNPDGKRMAEKRIGDDAAMWFSAAQDARVAVVHALMKDGVLPPSPNEEEIVRLCVVADFAILFGLFLVQHPRTKAPEGLAVAIGKLGHDSAKRAYVLATVHRFTDPEPAAVGS
jgi:ABC-type transport system substrate-binding protein